MLLAQPFEPQQHQDNRFSIILARAKRALNRIKNNRKYRRAPHQSFFPPLVPPPPPMTMWYMMNNSPPITLHPQLQAILSHQMPYSICVHFNAPCEHHHHPIVDSSSTLQSSDYEEEKEEINELKEQQHPHLTRSSSDTLYDRHRPPMAWNNSGFYSY